MSACSILLIALIAINIIKNFVLDANYAVGIALLIFFSTLLWADYDTKKLELQKYKAPWYGFKNPNNAMSAILLIWIIAFPVYLLYRQKILNGEIALSSPFDEAMRKQKIRMGKKGTS